MVVTSNKAELKLKIERIAVNLKPAVFVKVDGGVMRLLGQCMGFAKRHLARGL
jgi:hypothetical protein